MKSPWENWPDTLHKLKAKKASGPDSLRTDMLKHSTIELHKVLLKLFSLVLQAGCFPEVWKRGLRSTVFNSGDELDLNNNRGVCVNSDLGKGFCCVLNARLQAVCLIEHNARSAFYQNLYPKNEIKIFPCSVDFRITFD